MPEQLLTIFQICLLVLLYLFLARVVRAVWVEIGDDPGRSRTRSTKPRSVKAPATAALPEAARLVVVEPTDRRGQSVELVGVTTIGRAAACTVPIDDSYLSQHHARIRRSEGRWVIEDLQSTNGTYLNGVRLVAPSPLSVGDRVQLGDTILEVA